MARAALVNLGDGLAARVAPGPGETTFWIHGYTLTSACWAGVWERLPGWRHIGVDLPGHGNSLPRDGGDDGLPALARSIGALAVARGARHLVALSLGTVIALQVALEYPGAFATLTLASPMLGGGPFDPELWTRYGEVKALIGDGGARQEAGDHWMAHGASLFAGTERRPELREQLRRQVARHPWWELADDAYARLWNTPQSLRDLPGIGTPTLLLVGADDGAAVRQCAGFLERLIPGCERRDLPGLGHLCLLEEPHVVRTELEHHWRARATAAEAPSTGGNHHATPD